MIIVCEGVFSSRSSYLLLLFNIGQAWCGHPRFSLDFMVILWPSTQMCKLFSGWVSDEETMTQRSYVCVCVWKKGVKLVFGIGYCGGAFLAWCYHNANESCCWWLCKSVNVVAEGRKLKSQESDICMLITIWMWNHIYVDCFVTRITCLVNYAQSMESYSIHI